MKRLTLLLTVLGLIAGYPVFGQNGSSTCLHQWAPHSKVFQRGYQKQTVRGFQCQFCARFLTSLPSRRSGTSADRCRGGFYFVSSMTSWVSNPRNPNNVIIEKIIRLHLKKPTGTLTKSDLEKVTWLDLRSNQLTNVKGLEKLTQLTSLNLSRNQLAYVKELEKLTQLEYLRLDDNQLRGPQGLEKLTQLTYLDLRNNPNLTKAQIDQLQKALPRPLIFHDYSTNAERIEQAIRLQLMTIHGVKKPTGTLTKSDLEKVTWLDLRSNKLTDVTGLEKLNQLTKLFLYGNQLTDVKELEKLTQLTFLSLGNNPDLTKAQIAELQKALPKCRIDSNPTK